MPGMKYPAARISFSDQTGFTIIEVMVAMLIMVVGVLGTVTLIDQGNEKTVSTKAREAGTTLALEMIESARRVPYGELTPALLASRLQSQEGLASVGGGSTWVIGRRGFTYTVEEASVCSIDDPADGSRGVGAVGAFCAGSGTSAQPDSDPDDYKRVVVRLSWNDGNRAKGSVRQTTLIHPGQVAPTVLNLRRTNPLPATAPVTSSSSAQFAVDSPATPVSIEWSLDGQFQTVVCALPCPGSSTFTWNIGQPDGTYVVSAQAFDAARRSGGPRAITVRLNRNAPGAVSGLAGGRNGGIQAGRPLGVDLEWLANPESDVVGYRVFRKLNSSAGYTGGTQVCPPSGTEVLTQLSCRDTTTVDATTTYKYWVQAYDRDASGALRAGPTPVTPLVVGAMDRPPNPPTNLVATSTGGSTTLTWVDPKKDDPDGSDRIVFFRIYRDGTSYDVAPAPGRYDRVDENIFSYTDDKTGGTTHSYWVTSVSQDYNESLLLGPVTR